MADSPGVDGFRRARLGAYDIRLPIYVIAVGDPLGEEIDVECAHPDVAANAEVARPRREERVGLLLRRLRRLGLLNLLLLSSARHLRDRATRVYTLVTPSDPTLYSTQRPMDSRAATMSFPIRVTTRSRDAQHSRRTVL